MNLEFYSVDVTLINGLRVDMELKDYPEGERIWILRRCNDLQISHIEGVFSTKELALHFASNLASF